MQCCHLIVHRESKSVFHSLGGIGGKIGELYLVVGDGDMRIVGGEHHRHIVDSSIADIVQGKAHCDRLARVELVVVVAGRVVDGKAVISDGTQLDGFDSGQHVDATKARHVALAIRQRDGRLFKDTADIGRRQIVVFTQHQCHTSSHAGRRHRGAAHIGVAIVGCKVQRNDVDARSAHVGTDEADARVVGIVAKFGILPSHRTM